tara:strand:+ start:144 stop:989 length:846 start_codon:yes stop_codon:yes gene_type:complete
MEKYFTVEYLHNQFTMNELTKKLPVTLIGILNSFNKELSNFRREISIISNLSKVRLNSNDFEKITIRYVLNKSSFYFEINVLLIGDYIDWKFYPNEQESTKPSSRSRSAISKEVYTDLESKLIGWKDVITKVTELKDPLEFFNSDNFIEFYSQEILEFFPTTDEDEKYPLSSKKQKLATELIDKQSKFILKELSQIQNKESDKYYDLSRANRNLLELKEDIKVMTVEEVKRKWSLSLGAIVKWCRDKFIKYLKLDSANGHDVSRAFGSFIGGVFGIPKFDQ